MGMIVYMVMKRDKEYLDLLRKIMPKKDKSVYHKDTLDGLIYVGDIHKAIDEYEKYLIDMRIHDASWDSMTWTQWRDENLMIAPGEEMGAETGAQEVRKSG